MLKKEDPRIMESFMLAVSVVLPLVIYMAVGGIIKKTGIFSEGNFKALNVMIFRIFIPLTLFFNVYKADIGEAVRPGIFVFVVAGVLVTYVAAWILVSRWISDKRDSSTVIQGMYRSNYVLFGNTIAVALCGQSGVALVAALSAVIIPLFNILAVILFEVRRGGEIHAKEIVINIFKNPLVDAGLLGILFSGLHITIPELILNSLESLGDIATPLALVTLGGILSFRSMLRHWKYLIVAVLGKLIVVPLVMIEISIAAGISGDVLVAILAVFGSPTAVASTPMAQAMGGNGELAGEIVATTSVCCILTIFLFVFSLSRGGLI